MRYGNRAESSLVKSTPKPTSRRFQSMDRLPIRSLYRDRKSNPLVWLDQVDATANVEIDLPRMQAALPGLLPVREGAVLNRGVVRASIVPMNLNDRRETVRRRRFIMQSDAVEATADGKVIQIAPMDATAIVASDTTQLRAETV